MAGDERIDNQISGRVADGAKSVQARDIDGGMQEVAQHAEASGGAAIQQAGRDVNNTFTIVSSLPSASSRVVPLLRESAPPGFTGRGDELAALTAGLDNVGGQDKPVVIVVVSGPGGIGKTELALHWAYQHCGWFPDGQLFVDLSGFAHNGTPLPQGEAVRLLLSALGVASTSIPADLEDRVVRYHNLVAGKRMLIVLDNARDVSQVTGLLPGTGTCTVLITSRDRMDGLAVAYGARLLPVGVLGDSDARTLLARRVGQSRVDAAPEAVTELLRRCAGLPLALRIVASRTAAHPDFTLAVLATELRDVATRLGALDTGDPATTVEAVMSWSYDALTPEQARVFTLLGIAPCGRSRYSPGLRSRYSAGGGSW